MRVQLDDRTDFAVWADEDEPNVVHFEAYHIWREDLKFELTDTTVVVASHEVTDPDLYPLVLPSTVWCEVSTCPEAIDWDAVLEAARAASLKEAVDS